MAGAQDLEMCHEGNRGWRQCSGLVESHNFVARVHPYCVASDTWIKFDAASKTLTVTEKNRGCKWMAVQP